MRYFGKDGAQCQPAPMPSADASGRYRHYGRAVLFGRVPRSLLIWLGIGILAAALGAGVASLVSLGESSRGVRDASSAVSIRR